MAWVEILGYAASAAVLATFCMSTMIPLRALALVSNVLFCAYGALNHVYPVLILHALMFPINLWRLSQFRRLVNLVKRARSGDISIEGLLPYVTTRRLAAGETLVRKGEPADRLYYLAEGELEISELGKSLQSGAIVGEIGVFDRDQQRSATIVARTDCRLFELTESKAKQLFFQDRAFGFAVMQLIINRLLENNRRLLDSPASASRDV